MNENINEIMKYAVDVMKNNYQLSEKHISYCSILLKKIIDSINVNDKNSLDLNDAIENYLEILEENKNQYPPASYFQLKRLSNILKKISNGVDITQWKYEKHSSKFNICMKNSLLVDSFQNFLSHKMKQSTIYNCKSHIKKFLFYLENKGKTDISKIDMTDIYDYLYFVSIDSNQTINNDIYSIKAFINFLSAEHISHKLNAELISKPVPGLKRNYSMFSKEELDKLLSIVDTSTNIGKRDFAILSLAVTTALRSVDIAMLKLTDINWNRKEIVINQSKTGNINVLPLCKETGNAIADYIINGRPKTNSEYIFIRSKRPYIEINRKGTVQNIFLKYRKLAGLEHTLHDGRTMHGVRRSVASLLVNHDTDINTIAQILGHSQLSSIKIYASVDILKLRICSLTLEDYPVTGGIYHEK